MKRIVPVLLKSRVVALGLILGLPLAGVAGSGKAMAPFLAFPPRTVIKSHAPFSLPLFLLILAVILFSLLPLVMKGARYRLPSNHSGKKRLNSRPLPWWGKLAGLSLAVFWTLAWTRFDWFSPLQAHTFFPIWISLIIVINAITVKRTGACPMTASPRGFFLLFPVSAAFWWSFEFLNRFVCNWYYTGSQYPALTYFLLASLSFSTVLPAVESMKEYLASFERLHRGFRHCPALPRAAGKPLGGLFLASGCISLAFIALLPDPLFFTLWISPLFILLGHALVLDLPHPFDSVITGDLTPVVTYALAALCCGVFWELFNYDSLARWSYAIPYVQVLHIFEMPLLGYAGYLPFGLECAMIIHLVDHFKGSAQPAAA